MLSKQSSLPVAFVSIKLKIFFGILYIFNSAMVQVLANSIISKAVAILVEYLV
jgi:hypothetical protein